MSDNKKMTGASRQYDRFVGDISTLLETARRRTARVINTVLTDTYWEVGRRIVEFEQSGKKRAGYGKELLTQLSADLTGRFGRGVSRQNLQHMRQFYLGWPPEKICQTLSGELRTERVLQTKPGKSAAARETETLSRKFTFEELSVAFPLSWSHYVLLMKQTRSPEAVAFYETEVFRGGWLNRGIISFLLHFAF